MQMILPAARETAGTTPRRRNSRTASRAQRNCPVRLTPMTVSHCCSVISWKGRVLLQPGVVDQNIDCSELLQHLGEHRLHLVFAADIGANGYRFAPRIADQCDHALGFFRMRDVVDHDVGAGGAEREGAGFANAGVRAGHERLLLTQRTAGIDGAGSGHHFERSHIFDAAERQGNSFAGTDRVGIDLAISLVRPRPCDRMATETPNLPRQQPKKTTDYDEPGAQKQNGAHPETDPATGADYFEIVARATNDAVRDWNVSTGALLWPRGLESLLGYERSAANEKIGFWFDHIHPEDLARIQGSLRSAFTGSDETWKGEYRFRRADGAYVHILERALIFRDTRGAAVRGGADDGCDRPAVNCKRKPAARNAWKPSDNWPAASRTISIIFSPPSSATAICFCPRTAVKGQVADQIKEIRDAAGRASSLTNQLLAFSRRQALEPTVLEVNSLITNLERSLLRLLGDHISVVCHLHHLKEGAHIKVDAGQLTQIILNLAVNARDAMRKRRPPNDRNFDARSSAGRGPAAHRSGPSARGIRRHRHRRQRHRHERRSESAALRAVLHDER